MLSERLQAPQALSTRVLAFAPTERVLAYSISAPPYPLNAHDSPRGNTRTLGVRQTASTRAPSGSGYAPERVRDDFAGRHVEFHDPCSAAGGGR